MIKVLFLTLGLYSDANSPDSLRMETINGQAVIIHQVGERETLYSLSRRYGVPVTRILEFNPSADGGLEVGQLLKVPYVPKTRVQTAEGTTHKVQPKETLFSLSRMYGVTVDELKAWNHLRDNSISVGQELLVKNKQSASTAASTQAQPKPVESQPVEPKPAETKPREGITVKMTHTVSPGETLYSISRLYNVSVDQIRSWNGLQGNELKLSQVIYIAQPMFQPQTETKPADVPSQQTPKTSVQITRHDTSQPLATNAPPVAGAPVKISESVLGTDEVHELGLAELIEGTEGNRKYLAFHRTAKEGSILKVRNELNNREVFVRVAGTLPSIGTNETLVIKISRSAYDRLGAIDPRFRVEVTYYK